MLKKLFIIILLFSTDLFSQKKVEQKNLFSSYTLKSSRTHFLKELNRKSSLLLNGKINDEKTTISILNEFALLYFRPQGLYKFITGKLKKFESNSPKLNDNLLISLKALYPDSAKALVKRIVKETNEISTFVYGACHLMHYPGKHELHFIDSLLAKKFPHSKSLTLTLFRNEIKRKRKLNKQEIIEILSAPYQKGKTIIFSFQRENRKFPGLTIIRTPEGKFLREKNGDYFSVPQLALSAANLPGYLHNGNTPQGIFSIVGFYITQKESIGPTPIILTRIPFGKPPAIFFHGENEFKKWDIRDYKKLIPKNLRNYSPFYEAFFAGKLGRRLLVMHGSTDDLNFYKGENYFPLTPTWGCLSTIEIWDTNGHVIKSDQAKLANAFFETQCSEGFLIVLNLNNIKKPVSLSELEPLMTEAEKILALKKSPEQVSQKRKRHLPSN